MLVDHMNEVGRRYPKHQFTAAEVVLVRILRMMHSYSLEDDMLNTVRYEEFLWCQTQSSDSLSRSNRSTSSIFELSRSSMMPMSLMLRCRFWSTDSWSMSSRNFSDVTVSSSITVFSVSLSELSRSGPMSRKRTCPLVVEVRRLSDRLLGGGCGLAEPS
uniref:Uncharacterized protein n=1 Tax=Anopheles melas TaxID=34690 RepID=A0A182UE73_9DIPT